jgi:hypothetical protein
MTEPTLDMLTQRLDRLERENRWLKGGARSCPEYGGKEKWRILPVGEVRPTRRLAGRPPEEHVASGQIKLRRIDGWRKIATVLSQHPTVAA